MQASVGMPVMMLDRQNHFGNKANSKHGNLRAVLCEAMSERRCNDPDLNRERTEYNEYWGIDDRGLRNSSSGEAWADEYERMADEYRIVDKRGKEKRLRSDANVAFAGIIKPDDEFMQSLTEEQQFAFLSDSVDCIRDIYVKRGMKINMCVVHVDEGNPHVHYYGYDPEYKLSDKLKMPFYKALNVTEYPKMMKARGWDVKELTGYQEDTKDMTADQLEEYKAKKRSARKSGKSSKDYKADKDRQKAEQALAQAEQERKAVEARISRLNDKKAKFIEETNQQAKIMRERAKKQALLEAEEIKRQALLEAEEIKRQAREQARQEYMAIPEQTKQYAKQWEKHIQSRESLDSVGKSDGRSYGSNFSL